MISTRRPSLICQDIQGRSAITPAVDNLERLPLLTRLGLVNSLNFTKPIQSYQPYQKPTH